MRTALCFVSILGLALALPACGETEERAPPVVGGGEDSGDGDGDEDDDSIGGGGGGGCDEQEHAFTFTLEPPNVMLVLDKSRSMVTLWNHDGNPENEEVMRWTSLHGVVEQIAWAFDERMNFGAQLFPAVDADSGDLQGTACSVSSLPEVAVAPNNAQAVLEGIPAADAAWISGGTPANAGVESALGHLLGLEPGPRSYMVLVTDGAANCMAGVPWYELGQHYDVNLPITVGSAFADHQIPTFVVGINIVDQMITDPDANPWVELNAVAQAGGVARPGPEGFYNAFDEIELGDALDEVAARIECTLALETPPTEPDAVWVEIEGEIVPKVDSCTDEDGWVWTNGNGDMAIELCGTACDDLQEAQAAEVIYGCND